MTIKDSTLFLDSKWNKIPARQRRWHVDNQFYDFVYCLTCSTNTVNWSVKNKAYSRFCSSKCAHAHDSVRKKTEQTCLQKYGKTTNLATAENQRKQKDTCMKKYGVENYAKTTDFKKKYTATCLEKYGVDNASKLLEIKNKITASHQKKYNRKRSSQIHIESAIIDQKNNREYMLYLYKELKMPVTEIAKYLNVNHSQLCVHFKNNLNIDLSRHNVSWPETEIYNFVKTIASDAIQSDRSIISPKELDIVIPSKKVAIEYNGLVWHGEARGKKDKQYHLNKLKLANQQGYRLIQVFSNEWSDQQELVKSRLLNVLGESQRIAARKCTIKQLDKRTTDEFLNDNHIQKTCVCKLSYGLYHNNQLLGVMTFGKSRFNKQVEWELLRFACKQNYSIQGGAGRLFKHFCKQIQPLSVISYCDLRWNTGNLYQQLGFEFVKNTSPNYWYIISNTSLSNRIKYQKHKLQSLLPSFDPKLTEWENMLNSGFDRIWDCGNSVWIFK